MTRIANAIGRQKGRWIVASALVLATLGASAALRVPGKPQCGSPPQGTPGTAQFQALQQAPVYFRGNLDKTAVLQGGDGLVRMQLVIGAEERPAIDAERRPTDLLVVLDRSGSMGGLKIQQARAAIRELVAKLGPQDRFALVTYSSHAELAIPFGYALGAAPDAWLRTVASIGASGGTNMSAGLDVAVAAVERTRADGRVPRAILISDGLANEGDATHAGLMRRASSAARGEYMLSTVGVGADFNEALMTALADAGTGNYYYLESARGLGDVFAGEFDAARTTVASGLTLRIAPGDGVQVVEAAGYPLERSHGSVSFRPGSVFAGQEREIWVTLRVPNDRPGDRALGEFTLAYTLDGERTSLSWSEMPVVACTEDEDRFIASVEPGYWERSVVREAYGELQDKVGLFLREGRRDEALDAIEVYKQENEELNRHFNSPAVRSQLEAAGAMADEVDSAFRGPRQAEKRNRLSKQMSADSVDQRRAGNKN